MFSGLVSSRNRSESASPMPGVTAERKKPDRCWTMICPTSQALTCRSAKSRHATSNRAVSNQAESNHAVSNQAVKRNGIARRIALAAVAAGEVVGAEEKSGKRLPNGMKPKSNRRAKKPISIWVVKPTWTWKVS